MGMMASGAELQGSVPCHPRIGMDGAIFGVDFPIDDIAPSFVWPHHDLDARRRRRTSQAA
jgi:hypothetical protein